MQHRPNAPRAARRGFTLVEAMVVVAVIALLISIIVPAVGLLRSSAKLVTSQSNLRTVAALMTAYSLDNRDFIVPSQFDDGANPFAKGLVRTASPAGTQPNVGPLRKGSWTDILWSVNKFGPIAVNADATDIPSPQWDYRYDSPDYYAYASGDTIDKNPFRSTVPIKKPFVPDASIDAASGGGSTSLPRPFGNGASSSEAGQPGYYAANDFFDATPRSGATLGNWYTNAMIKRPSQSMYAVDSRAGETIPTTTDAWKVGTDTCEVEFRYIGEVCTMLYLDGHVTTEAKWIDLVDLQTNRQVRVTGLDQR